MDGAAAVKLESGEAGYVLEDVPHVSDYLPDLPVSAAASRARSGGGSRSGGSARPRGEPLIDRCCWRRGCSLRGIVAVRPNRARTWNLMMIRAI